MSKQTIVRQEAESGLRRALAWILGAAWFGFVIWGIVNAFGSDANFSPGHHPSRVLGYLILGVAGVVFAATANRWKRLFPGIMIAATFGALLELEQGHVVNNPSVPIRRWIALVQLIVIATVTVLSFTFKKRRLNVVDRLALLAFAGSIVIGGDEATRQKIPLALIIGGVCMVAAWTYNRVRAEHGSSH